MVENYSTNCPLFKRLSPMGFCESANDNLQPSIESTDCEGDFKAKPVRKQSEICGNVMYLQQYKLETIRLYIYIQSRIRNVFSLYEITHTDTHVYACLFATTKPGHLT